MDIQITLIDKSGTYKPHSTVLRDIDTQGLDFATYYRTHAKTLHTRAIENICHQLKCNWSELKKQGFTQVKAREYDLEKIEQQKRIQRIKALYEKRKGGEKNV